METKYIPVSMEKLKRELSKRGRKVSEVSRMLGYDANYVSNQFARTGGLREYVIRAVEMSFRIPRESFVVQEIQEPKEQVDDKSINVRLDDLIEGQTAIIHLLERLEDTIFKAVDKAWRQ